MGVSGEDAGRDLAHLPLVTSHQHRILERLLRQLFQLGEIFVQHLDLLDAGDRLAFRRAPARNFAAFAVGHADPAYFGAAPCGASPSPGFFCPPGAEKIICPIRFSRLTGDWVNLICPPGGIVLSSPPGPSDMYCSPSRPLETISATVSSGNL